MLQYHGTRNVSRYAAVNNARSSAANTAVTSDDGSFLQQQTLYTVRLQNYSAPTTTTVLSV